MSSSGVIEVTFLQASALLCCEMVPYALLLPPTILLWASRSPAGAVDLAGVAPPAAAVHALGLEAVDEHLPAEVEGDGPARSENGSTGGHLRSFRAFLRRFYGAFARSR